MFSGIIDAGFMLQHINLNQDREKILNYLAKQMDMYLVSTQNLQKGCCKSLRDFLSQHACLFCSQRYGNYLMGLYLIVKVLYLVNAIAQVFLLNGFLKTDYHIYGIEVMVQFLKIDTEEWPISPRFPRVTLCDFYVRQLANTHRHTVQCVLPINLFNEKIFMFIWFWLLLMSILSFYNLCIWIGRCMCARNQGFFIKKHLKIILHDDEDLDEVRKLAKPFVLNYLRQDGILVLRLLEFNTNSLVAAELINTLWRHFKLHKPNLRIQRNPSAESFV